jgi:hypothetical protein
MDGFLSIDLSRETIENALCERDEMIEVIDGMVAKYELRTGKSFVEFK